MKTPTENLDDYTTYQEDRRLRWDLQKNIAEPIKKAIISVKEVIISVNNKYTFLIL